MVTARLPPLLRATALATTTLLGKTRLVKNRLDLARRIIQHTLNLVHLIGIKRGRHLINATRKLLSTTGLPTGLPTASPTTCPFDTKLLRLLPDFGLLLNCTLLINPRQI